MQSFALIQFYNMHIIILLCSIKFYDCSKTVSSKLFSQYNYPVKCRSSQVSFPLNVDPAKCRPAKVVSAKRRPVCRHSSREVSFPRNVGVLRVRGRGYRAVARHRAPKYSNDSRHLSKRTTETDRTRYKYRRHCH